ncbi:MAG: hypothetical protein QM767_02580 [Anaeromyxobacter sp.]
MKHETLTAMERERKAASATVEVTAAGAVRGFDAMHLATTAGRRFAPGGGRRRPAVPHHRRGGAGLRRPRRG